MNLEWNSVTWYSKIFAVIVFVFVLIFGTYLGSQFQSLSDEVNYESASRDRVPTSSNSSRVDQKCDGTSDSSDPAFPVCFLSAVEGKIFMASSPDDGYGIMIIENAQGIKVEIKIPSGIDKVFRAREDGSYFVFATDRSNSPAFTFDKVYLVSFLPEPNVQVFIDHSGYGALSDQSGQWVYIQQTKILNDLSLNVLDEDGSVKNQFTIGKHIAELLRVDGKDVPHIANVDVIQSTGEAVLSFSTSITKDLAGPFERVVIDPATQKIRILDTHIISGAWGVQ